MFRLILVYCLTLTFSSAALAAWVQGEASLIVNDAPLDEVRVMALKNAIADASFKSGSMINAEEITLNGLLMSSKTEIRTAGRIQRVEILSETLEKGVLTVVVNVNLSPLFDCASDKYARSILVTQFQLLRPGQAAWGGIYDLGKQISKRFEQQFRAQPSQPSVMLLDKAFASTRSYDELSNDELNHKAQYLSQTYGRQFVVFGFVRDISLFEQVREKLLKDEVELKRNFTIQVYVLDAYRNSLIFEESYHSEAHWQFGESYLVDTNNSLFWRSDFGRMVLNTVNASVTDIASALQCEQTLAQVLDKDQDEIMINMGKSEGVATDDVFVLYKNRLITRNHSAGLKQLVAQPRLRYRVLQVNPHTSVLTLEQPEFSDGELFDLLAPLSPLATPN